MTVYLPSPFARNVRLRMVWLDDGRRSVVAYFAQQIDPFLFLHTVGRSYVHGVIGGTYDLWVQYSEGIVNAIVDALSRTHLDGWRNASCAFENILQSHNLC